MDFFISDYGPLKFIETLNGARLLMVNRYTYLKNNRAKYCYYCSGRTVTNCKGSVKLNRENKIQKDVRNHKPPVYRKLNNGRYKKVAN